MTRKDYETIAAAFRSANYYFSSSMFFGVGEKESAEKKAALNYTANQLADRIAADHPKFDRARFIAACKGEKP
jgi:CRISPR/Cas system-associated protein Cas10 (large subunit of type III CRISPR-Cas system)